MWKGNCTEHAATFLSDIQALASIPLHRVHGHAGCIPTHTPSRAI
jgi:hypothetical protein